MSRPNELAEFVASELIRYVENRAAQVKGFRYDYLDTMSAQRFRNRDFEGLLSTYLNKFDDVADEVDRSGRMSLEAIVEETIPQYVDGHFADFVLGSRLADEVNDRDYNEMCDVADQWKSIWMARGGRRRNERSSVRQYSNRSNPDAKYDRSRAYTGSSRRSSSNTFSRDELTSGIRSSPGRVATSHRPKVAAGMWGAVTQVAAEESRLNDVRREEPREVREAREEIRVPEAKIRNSKTVTFPDLPDGLDWTKPKPHEEYLEQDEWWRHSPIVDADTNRRLNHHPSFYDVNNTLRYVVMSRDGSIREEFVEVDEDNRYLQQELLSNKITNRRTSNQISLKHNPAPVEEEEDYVEKTSLLSDVLRDVAGTVSDDKPLPLSTTIGEALEATLLELTHNREVTSVFQTHVVRDVVLLIGDKDEEKFLMELESANTLVQFHEILDQSKGLVDVNLWNKVNRRMSVALGESMCFQWRRPSKNPINFHNDYLKILSSLPKLKGVTQEYVSKFVKRTTPLIQQVTSRLTPDEVSPFIQDIVPASHGDDGVNAVVFINYEYIYALRNTADALGIGKQLEDKISGVAVRQIEGPELQIAIRELYRNIPYSNTAKRSIQPLRLVTQDYKLITVYPFECRTDEFILSQPKDSL